MFRHTLRPTNRAATSPTRTTPPPETFHPTPLDIIITSRLLQTLLPPELVLPILHFASYYPVLETHMPYPHSISSSSGRTKSYVGCQAVLITPPIPRGVKSVVSARWRIKSNDQGWSGEPEENKGTYKCSWTWFDAEILRGEGECRMEEMWRGEEGRGMVNVTDPEVGWPGEGWREVRRPAEGEGEEGRRWLVQRNRNTVTEPKEHVVEWLAGEKPEVSEEDAHDSTVDAATGSGTGAGFLEELRPGDRVVLLAHALYPGWTNTVHNAEVQLEFSTEEL